MDCRTCQPNLLDLAHGELAPELSATVSEHVKGCASCSSALGNLKSAVQSAGELPWLEPPPSLRANALAFAAQHAEQRALAAAASASSVRAREGVFKGVLDFLGRLAAGRQFAMATVMVLIVAVGLWSLPHLQHMPSGQGITVVSPDPDGEAAPSGGLAPAEPLDLTVDARSRRIRSREEIAADPSVNAYKPQAEASADMAAAAVVAEALPATPEQKVDELDLDNLDSVLAEPSQARSPQLAQGEALAEAASAQEPARKSASRSKRKSDPEAFPKSEGEMGLDGLAAAQGGGTNAELQASSAPSAPAAKPSTSAGDPLLLDTYELRNGASTGSAKEKQALKALERARELRANGGCAAALSTYEQATKDAASRGTALIELATCQRELGRESTARALLEQAAAIPSVAARARSLLSTGKSAKPAAKTDSAASSSTRD